MSRRGNPYDNAQAESFIKTLKVEAAYLMAYEENFFTFHRLLLRDTRNLGRSASARRPCGCRAYASLQIEPGAYAIQPV